MLRISICDGEPQTLQALFDHLSGDMGESGLHDDQASSFSNGRFPQQGVAVGFVGVVSFQEEAPRGCFC